MEEFEIGKEMAPRIRKMRGKKVVIKFGGSSLNANGDLKQFCNDIALLVSVGVRPVIVHGGGPEINAEMKRLGMVVKKVMGLRVTDDQTLDVAKDVLSRMNAHIVEALKMAGVKAIGIPGAEGRTVICRKMDPVKVTDKDGNECLVDLGNVGEVVSIDPTMINLLCASKFVPVIYPICADESGCWLNVNADTAAAHIAHALHSEDMVLVTDVPGLMKENGNGATVIHETSLTQLDSLISAGIVTDGMVPKLEACRLAVLNGVKTVHMVSGKEPHSILNQLIGGINCGTRITF